jgi:hypothetical protein
LVAWLFEAIASGVSLCGLAMYIIKRDLKATQDLYGNSNISPCKNIYLIFKKILLKKNQNPPRDHSSITNLKFQYKPKYHLPKILI